MKKFLSVLLALSLFISVFAVGGFTASAATYGDLTYTVENGKAIITECSRYKTGSLTIPNKLGGYPVTAIGKNAFEYCEYITRIIIPDSVTTIDEYAFFYCSSLTSITIPDSVVSIGDYAFAYCYNMEELTFGEGVTTIGESAFMHCESVKSLIIPDSVTEIKSKTFYKAYALESLTIGENITAINDEAFAVCSELRSVTIPASVTYISGNAFSSCIYLRSINVDEDNQTFASIEGVLFNKDKTKLILCPNGKKDSQYVIPWGVTEIGDRAFANSSIRSIVMWQDVKTIGQNAFDGCWLLTDIYVKETNQYFSSIDGILFNKDKTVLVTYPQGKHSIEYAIPDSVIEINDYAFTGGIFFQNITIGENVSVIGEGVFASCDDLVTIELDKKNTSFCLVDGVLLDKDKTRLIRYPANKDEYRYFIPHTVTKIDAMSFPSDDSLKEITIPASVRTIGDSAFEFTEKLYWINYDADVKEKNKIKIHENNYYLNNGAWHYYTNGCDEECNQCGMLRDIVHTYDDEYDKICNNCKYVRTITDEKLVKESGKWYYYIGSAKSNLTTLVKYKNEWFYVKNGVWDNTATTLVKYNGQYFYIKNGKWIKTANTLVKYSGKWFYVKNGKWASNAKTIVKYNGKWFYVKNGKWCKDKDIVKYSGKTFYVNKGFAQLSYSGNVKIGSKTYKIKKGKVV